MLDYSKSFIEEQFPVAKVSKESYRERKAVQSQTLTGLGKWWGRKPLILVRAALFGALLPVSDDKKKDKEVFLRILTMDYDGLHKRIEFQDVKKQSYDVPYGLTYEAALNEACRPEEIDGPSEESWKVINEHLQTNAHTLQELAQQLGQKRYGHIPRIGDCFAGGGSNVFEPARMGCDVYGSDLNPLAALLTWADLNILGATDKETKELIEFQNRVLDSVKLIISEMDVECRDGDFVAKSYLYCNETRCPECGYKVPLLPTLVVSHKNKLVVDLIKNQDFGFDLDLKKVKDLKEADRKATVQKSSLVCPCCGKTTSLVAIRGGKDGIFLRNWKVNEYLPKDEDLFSERLYAIKFVFTGKGKKKDAFFRAPNAEDLEKEKNVLNVLCKHFDEWQEKGFIPDAKIYGGYNTDQPIRERGWNYWHQLYNPRQLLINALVSKELDKCAKNHLQICASMLILNKLADWNSKLCRWGTGAARESIAQTFYNQALNTMWNYGVRSFDLLRSAIEISIRIKYQKTQAEQRIDLIDARKVEEYCDIWITDPPYADAVNYHELSEFFLAWDKHLINKAFPDWYTDSKRVLAIKGTGVEFNKSMVEVYRNLAAHMPDDGMQIVMFTHQDTKVWAELSMILWSAGLQVTAAWCIATETESGGLKQGNYVKGTVLMVLRKRTSTEVVFEDDLYEEIHDAVQEQIESMRDLDEIENPDFNDGDYLLAAYVAALKVLTSYAEIEGLDVQYELEKARDNAGNSPVTEIINSARKVAYDYLVPDGISTADWSKLTAEERFYIKGLSMELNGVHTLAAFQELARGFAVSEYTDLMGSIKSNAVRLKLPTEFKMNHINDGGFGETLLRHVLAAIYQSANKDNVQDGCSYLRSHYAANNQYWALRNRIVALLEFMSKVRGNANVAHWDNVAEYIYMLKEAVRNDSL